MFDELRFQSSTPPQADAAVRRQLPENFSAGDQTRFSLEVSGAIVQLEKGKTDGYLVTVAVSAMKTRSTQTVSRNGNAETVDRVRPVLWSLAPDGSLELVIDVSDRQRLQVVGPTARERALVAEHLANLPPAHARELLQGLVQNEASGTGGSPPQQGVNITQSDAQDA